MKHTPATIPTKINSPKILALALLLTSFTATTFGAAEHDPLKKLADVYAKSVFETQKKCDEYTQCLQKENFRFECQVERGHFIAQSEILQRAHRDLARQCTTEQLIDISLPLHETRRFNLLEPEPQKHFRSVLFALAMGGMYRGTIQAIEKTKEELKWRTQRDQCTIQPVQVDGAVYGMYKFDQCKILQETLDEESRKKSKLEIVLRHPEVASQIAQHAPEFHAAHSHLFTPDSLPKIGIWKTFLISASEALKNLAEK